MKKLLLIFSLIIPLCFSSTTIIKSEAVEEFSENTNCEDSKNSSYMEEYKIHAFPTVFVVTAEGKKVQLDNNTFFNDNSKTVIKDNALEIIEDKKEDSKEDKKED